MHLNLIKIKLLFPFLIIFLLALSSCQSSKEISREEPPAACTDKLYLELQKRDSSTYTDFEKKYFRQKTDECRNALTNTIKKKEHDEKQEAGEKAVLGIAIAAGIIIGVLLGFLLVGYKQ